MNPRIRSSFWHSQIKIYHSGKCDPLALRGDNAEAKSALVQNSLGRWKMFPSCCLWCVHLKNRGCGDETFSKTPLLNFQASIVLGVLQKLVTLWPVCLSQLL